MPEAQLDWETEPAITWRPLWTLANLSRSSEELVGYLDRLQAHQRRLAAVRAAVVFTPPDG